MDRSAVVYALFLAILTLAIGLLIFRRIFDLTTMTMRPGVRGLGGRVRQWLRRYVRRIVLVALLIGAGAALVVTGVRFGPPAVEALREMIQRRTAAAEPAPEPVPVVEEPAPPPAAPVPAAIVADHRIVDEVRLNRIAPERLQQAAQNLRILFVHGTHGAQITYGLKALAALRGAAYAPPHIDALEFADKSEPDLAAWADRARSYLSDPANREVNVVMWLWSDELTTAGEEHVSAYLDLTAQLEAEFPETHFVYTTGHLDGSGTDGNLTRRNEQIRRYCLQNVKVLYDFADIESWDPDGNYYGDRRVNDGCWYDSDGDGSLDRNWAKEWSDANPGAWYDCYSPHTFPLNANLKAYAAWWLWVALAEKGQADGSR